MDELLYAIECGVKIEYRTLADGTVEASWNNKQFTVQMTPAEYAIFKKENGLEEKTEAQLLMENAVFSISKPKQTELLDESLTEKENQVLKVIIDNTIEYGLPDVTVDMIAEKTGLSKKSIVGVISSLYKKDYLESYDFDSRGTIGEKGIDTNEFILKAEAYEKFIGEFE